ncbi:MAG: nitrogen fixation protein NifZ [Azoarcus sp.]|uniref:Nitrogen fixation protein NifZ n=1 Tax=Aromatoleum tolulyticum TaxID=34027 RepID=A0A1N7B5K2_9RHOO|nr:nitrogen fixation protein NifZ [Aromatoleum tolulyticum]MCK9983981.1 nitrogen fixation protein NifZ [Azoarcus sp.]SIR46517.1 nitrogen fixation protein NifZ [Aromatoleum tolulyticum]
MKINRDGDIVELNAPPRFGYGEKVMSTKTVRNDGTFPGREIGDILVKKGDVGYVSSIGTFLQQFYIYGVEFVDHGYRVGMKGRELESLDYDDDEDEADAATAAADLENIPGAPA